MKLFAAELLQMADRFKEHFATRYNSLLAPPVPKEFVSALLDQLSLELSQIPGLAISPLRRFMSESRIEEARRSEEKKLERTSYKKRIVIAVILPLVGIGVLVSPVIRNWAWLQNHPNRLGLYGAATLILFGLCWAIVDRKRREVAFISIVIAGLFVILQIIGR